MASTNVSAYASVYLTDVAYDPATPAFVEKMFATADSPDAHEEWADLFTSDATIQVGPKIFQGRDSAYSTSAP